MKTLKFFTDTETTGLLAKLDQVLTYSVVLEEEGGQTVEELEQQIILKDNVLPNPKALMVNNINPFSKEWKNNSISEFEAYLKIKEVALKAKRENKRIILIAYNADFDKQMYLEMFARFGENFSDYFPVIWDPLPTAKKLIEQETIQTELIQATYSKAYRTSKLEAVYKALGYDSSKFQAHTALDDTRMLQMVAHGVYFLSTGKKLEEMQAHPDVYKVNDIVHIINDESLSGLVKKHVKVLFNDLTQQKLLVLDEELIKAQSPEGAIKWLNYYEIFDEIELDSIGSKRVENYFNSNHQIIMEVANTFLNKKEKKQAEKLDFSKVITLSEKVLASENKKKTIEELSEEEKDLLTLAESYAYGKYNKGWTREIEGPNYLIKSKKLKFGKYTLEMDPKGLYVLLDKEEEIIKTEKKTEIQDKFLNLLNLKREDQEFKDISKAIPSTKDFKNLKHPEGIKEEFENAKAEVFNGSNKAHKDLLTELLQYYKKKAPDTFKEVDLPSFKLDLSSLMKKKTV